LQEALPNISIKIFDALKTVTLPENLKEKILAESNLSVFSSVLGLATRKLDVFGYYEYVTGTNNINLLPNRDGVKNQEKMKFLSRWGVVIFVALSIFTAAWSFFNDDANILTLSGLSISDQNILQFIENLGESSVIDKASLLTMSIQVKNKRNYKSFSIRCRLVKQKTLENKEKLNGN